MKIFKAILKPLRNKKGESLVEVLIAMVIIVISSLLFVKASLSSANIITESDKRIRTLYEQMSNQERYENLDDEKVKLDLGPGVTKNYIVKYKDGNIEVKRQ